MLDLTRLPTVDVDEDALVANYRFLKALVAPAECAAVVKCGAYGLGDMAARALAEAGCSTFFVTYPGEATIRPLVGDSRIYVFNGPDASTLDLFRDLKLTPVLNGLEQAQLWAQSEPGAPAALHFDTGMNRLGARPEDAAAIAALKGLNIELVMSHLACPSPQPTPMNERQRAAFEDVARHFPKARKSLSASGGALMDERYHYDLVRPGIALYGASPFDVPDPRLSAVVRRTAPVLQMRQARPGDSVGYGAAYCVSRPSLLATVALGYGDGYPRSGGNRGVALLGGALCPIVGRVSMDLIVLDATDAPEKISVGDRAEFFGPNLPIEQAAAAAGTIAYELLTSLGGRAGIRTGRRDRDAFCHAVVRR